MMEDVSTAFRPTTASASSAVRCRRPGAQAPVPTPRLPPAPSGSPEAARRLFASGKPILETIAETYLRSRGIAGLGDLDCLRFHPRCYYRAHDSAPRETWPALVAAVTDLDGALTGVLRTWLARDGSGKAPLATPRRALTAAVFNQIAKHATWPQIVRWSSEPALLSVFRFGKHRGERFDAVPEDYLRWVVEEQHELREEVRASARYWLDRRASNGPLLPGL
jgi:hypothetical protein